MIKQIMQNTKNYLKNLTSNKILLIGLVIFIVVAILLMFLPSLILNATFGYELGVSKSNEIGDTIGGIMGPAVGLLAVLLTFLAFWAQIKANEQVQKQFKTQEFNNKFMLYYDLLKNSRKNIYDYSIKNIHGYKINSFFGIITEFIHLYNVILKIDYFLFYIHQHNEILHRDNDDFSIENQYLIDTEYNFQNRKIELIKWSWFYCFSGFKKFSKLTNTNFFIDVHNNLGYKIFNAEQINFIKDSSNDDFYLCAIYLNKNLKIKEEHNIDTKNILNNIFDREYRFYNYDGNYDILSPYFQLFYQIVKYINESEYLDLNEKYSLVKILRTEMTKDEIFVFFLNSLFDYGFDWEFKFRNYNNHIQEMDEKMSNQCLITKYNLIKHILDDTEIDINFNEIFPDLIFSWDSDSERKRKKAYRNKIFN